MKLLIVDDHAVNLRLLRAQLEVEGHIVVEAGNGVDALEVLSGEPVDGVISDILMPRMDGYRLCLEVRRDPRMAQLPLVLYTSTYNSQTDRELAQAAGADAYICKPAPVHTLLAALRAAGNAVRTPPAALQTELADPVLKQYNQSLVRKLEDKSWELERACEGLAQTEARLSGLVESALDAIVAFDEAQNVVLFNAAAERMFGMPRGQVLGRSLDAFIPARVRASHRDNIERYANSADNERPMSAILVVALRSDGSEFPIEASISKLETSQGRLYTAFVRDVTERERSQQALARSEASLRQAQQVARLAHVVTNADTGFESWSETLPTLIGLDPAEIPRTGQAWLEYIHPDDRERVRASAMDTMRTGERNEVEYRLRSRGDWVLIHQVMNPMPSSHDQARWLTTLQDVTELKAAQSRLRSLNRVLTVLSGINRLIVRATDRDELLREACRIAVEAGQFPRVWIGLVSPVSGRLELQAGSGLDEAFLDSVRRHLGQDTIGGKDVFADVMASHLPAVANDVGRELPTLDPVITARTGSIAILPLINGDTGFGVLALHAESVGFFDSEEIELLRELAGNISLALDHLHNRERVEYLARHDPLTGLPNRRLFGEQVDRMVLQAPVGDDGLLAVVLLDLERFRQVNETLGRAAGDELLRQAASRLHARAACTAALGAGVFAFTIHARSVAETSRALEQVVVHCCDAPFVIDGEELRMGTRAGTAVFPGDGTDAEALLCNAEAALRRAKTSNEHHVFYAPDLNARAAEALNLESRLRRAVQEEAFVLHYQPKVNLADRGISGLEALIRWPDPERGLVPPGHFIPLLEDLGLIARVGDWVVRQALADQQRWRAAGTDCPRIAVNVSSLHLRRHEFETDLRVIVDASPGAELELELTESVLMESIERNIETLRAISASGIRVAIDDFGTGFCSLAYLARLPVNTLKIDRSFVVGMTAGPEGLAIVSSIIALAHSLKLQVVAEGVETAQQAACLRKLGCDEAQGYFFSRPVAFAEMTALLRDGHAVAF